jgi:DNA-binding NtrC family response regulator
MKACILIVDDEEEIRNSLARHYQMIGFDTRTAESVDSALQVLNHHAIQIVISDIMMPGKPGTELLRVLTDSFPMIRAIMITGYVTLDNALTCMRKGADTCIFKPFNNFKELDDAVERAYQWHIRWQSKLNELQRAK